MVYVHTLENRHREQYEYNRQSPHRLGEAKQYFWVHLKSNTNSRCLSALCTTFLNELRDYTWMRPCV